MSERQAIVNVFPNKWLLLDPKGKPICAVPRDHREDGPGHIGARFDPETKTMIHIDGPARCRATRYTRDRVVGGELFPATAEDAKILRVPFVDPMKLLETAKAAAVAQYDAQFGDGAWAASNEPAPTEPDKPKDAKPAKAAKNS